MSGTTIEFFWDVVSSYTYLASTRIDRVGRECGVPVRWRPFLLGGVFRQTGNRPPAEVPAKFAYMLDDLKTWASYYKVSFRFPESFPLNSLMPMRAAVFADRSGKGHEFALAMMQAYWCEGRDPSLPEIVQGIARSVGLDGDRTIQMTQDPDIKEELKGNSEEAVRRGAFGAPTFFVGKKMFCGNDRLVMLEAYLKGELPAEF
jgi:2-hydroxychromene-2-carboxylate isomerase